MNISRNEVNEFYFSSALAQNTNTILTIASADNNTRNIYVTDLKLSCGGTSRTVALYVSSYGTYGYKMTFDLPANSMTNFMWELPYRFQVKASTLEHKRFLASASGTGVKYSISGYTEKL